MALHKAAAGLLDRRMIELTKATAEGDQISVGQLLISKQQHLMIEPRTINRFKLIIVNFSNIDAVNLSAQRLARWDDLQRTPHRAGIVSESTIGIIGDIPSTYP